MSQIIIDHNPSQEKLQELGVSSWNIWDCPHQNSHLTSA